jgi:hypothetical protein
MKGPNDEELKLYHDGEEATAKNAVRSISQVITYSDAEDGQDNNNDKGHVS